ncbi:hypothetical protein PROFUN_06301, partial [Planoprotostelium fungivorum]
MMIRIAGRSLLSVATRGKQHQFPLKTSRTFITPSKSQTSFSRLVAPPGVSSKSIFSIIREFSTEPVPATDTASAATSTPTALTTTAAPVPPVQVQLPDHYDYISILGVPEDVSGDQLLEKLFPGFSATFYQVGPNKHRIIFSSTEELERGLTRYKSSIEKRFQKPQKVSFDESVQFEGKENPSVLTFNFSEHHISPLHKMDAQKIKDTPEDTFKGEIKVYDRHSDLRMVAEGVVDLLGGKWPEEVTEEIVLEAQIAQGMDIEWKPNWEKGSYNLTSILQLSNGPKVAIFRLLDLSCLEIAKKKPAGQRNRVLPYGDRHATTYHMKNIGQPWPLPEILVQCLSSPHIKKVGVGAKPDGLKISKDFGIEVEGVHDILDLPITNRFSRRSVEALSAHFLLFRPEKTSTMCNWENKVTQKQLLYAATDAHCSRELYLILREVMILILAVSDGILQPDGKHFLNINTAKLCSRFGLSTIGSDYFQTNGKMRATILFLLLWGAIAATQSDLVDYDSKGRLTYKKNEQGDRIMDYSSVGYRSGKDIPAASSIPDKVTVKPSGGDDTNAIAAAIEKVAGLPLDSNGFR